MRHENHNFWVQDLPSGWRVTIWAERWDGTSRWRQQVNDLYVPAEGSDRTPLALLRGLIQVLETPFYDRPQQPARPAETPY